MPEGAVYVGRPGKWGNPFNERSFGRTKAVDGYRSHLKLQLKIGRLDPEELRGKDLACWCPLDQPCHADVLLELANS